MGMLDIRPRTGGPSSGGRPSLLHRVHYKEEATTVSAPIDATKTPAWAALQQHHDELVSQGIGLKELACCGSPLRGP